jgi:hypothetical protein
LTVLFIVRVGEKRVVGRDVAPGDDDAGDPGKSDAPDTASSR